MSFNVIAMLLFLFPACASSQEAQGKSVEKNGMEVRWHHENDRLWLEMKAPTKGWVAVGINESEDLIGSYWLMGRVVKGTAEVEEHYTEALGVAPALTSLGEKAQVSHVAGKEEEGHTWVSCSIPIEAGNGYAKNLQAGKAYVFHIAYSVADEYEHHSRMRTLIHVQL